MMRNGYRAKIERTMKGNALPVYAHGRCYRPRF